LQHPSDSPEVRLVVKGAQHLPRHWTDIRAQWPVLTLYQRVETTLAYLLTFVIGAVILVAFGRLVIAVVDTLVLRSLSPLDHSVFQQVFGHILTLLIAMEFNYTLRYTITGERGIIQAPIVVVIAVLALARKVIILDATELSPALLLSLAVLTVSLGATYWLIRDKPPRRLSTRRRA